MRRLLLLLVTLATFGHAAANPSPLINNTANRATISLDGAWQAIVDPFETGLRARFFLNAKAKDKQELLEYDFDTSGVLNVPGDWNSQKKGTVLLRRAGVVQEVIFSITGGSTPACSCISELPTTSLALTSTDRN